jgi:hypothetical protein
VKTKYLKIKVNIYGDIRELDRLFCGQGVHSEEVFAWKGFTILT